MPRVAVTSIFFSRFPELERAVLAAYPDAKILRHKDYLDEDELIAFCRGHDAAVVAIRPAIGARILDALPELKVVACCSAGLDHVDAAAFHARGVRVGWFPGVNQDSVAELTVSLMVALLRKVHVFNWQLRAGEWPPRRVGALLKGRVVGIHGCGHIGKQVVRLLQPYGCQAILACDIRDYGDFYRAHGVRAVAPDELWAESEILSVHLPKNAGTIGLYTAAVQEKLRPGMLLLNIARGGLFDEAALKENLKSGRIAQAAFDVFATEPDPDPELVGLPNMLATPHIGGSAAEAWVAMGLSGIRGVTENFLPEPGVYPFD